MEDFTHLSPVRMLMDSTSTYSEMTPDFVFAFWFYFVISILLVVTWIVLLYITITVVKKVWDTEKLIPLMLINLQLATLSFVVFFVEQMIELALFSGDVENLCINTICLTLSTLFLGLAVLLNITKWIYFSMRIMANVKTNEQEKQLAIQSGLYDQDSDTLP
jgi:hypothetical protein